RLIRLPSPQKAAKWPRQSHKVVNKREQADTQAVSLTPLACLVAHKEHSRVGSGRARTPSAAVYRSDPTRLRGHPADRPVRRNGSGAQSSNWGGAHRGRRQSPALCPRRDAGTHREAGKDGGAPGGYITWRQRPGHRLIVTAVSPPP